MKPKVNLPNIVTASRIFLTPVFLWLMLSNDGFLVQLSAAVFIIAAVSDWVDGWVARRSNTMSAFGTFFDPLADKIFIGAAFFAFAALDILSLWMVIVIVGRDLLLTVLRVLADRKGQPVVTSRLAKWKTALQLIFLWYVVAAFTLGSVESPRWRVPADVLQALLSSAVVDPIMLLLVALSIVTAISYVVVNRHVFGTPEKQNYAGPSS